jgi:YHS domain-containing protein
MDPVCGMAVKDSNLSFNYKGEKIYFCADSCLEQFKADPPRFKNIKGPQGKYDLAFYDTRTGQSLLKVPLIFKSREETPNDSCEHH